MADFLVSWVIDMDDCATPQEAAERALAIHRKPDSIATVFEVKDKASGETVTVDLDPEEALDELGLAPSDWDFINAQYAPGLGGGA